MIMHDRSALDKVGTVGIGNRAISGAVFPIPTLTPLSGKMHGEEERERERGQRDTAPRRTYPFASPLTQPPPPESAPDSGAAAAEQMPALALGSCRCWRGREGSQVSFALPMIRIAAIRSDDSFVSCKLWRRRRKRAEESETSCDFFLRVIFFVSFLDSIIISQLRRRIINYTQRFRAAASAVAVAVAIVFC